MDSVTIVMTVMATIIAVLLSWLWQGRHRIEPISAGVSPISFQELANALCEGCFDVNLQTGSYNVNDSWLISTGYEPTSLPPLMFDMLEQLIHPDDMNSTLDAINRSIEGQTTEKIALDVRVRHSHGHWLWMRSTAQVFFDETGQAIRLLSSHMDISAVKENEQALHDGQLLAGLRNCRFDPTTNMMALGPPPVIASDVKVVRQWIYLPLSKIIHPDDLSIVLKTIDLAYTDKTPLEVEFRLLTLSGNTRNIVLYGELKSDANGKFTSMQGVFRDITKQKRDESRHIEFGKLLEGSRTGLLIVRKSDLTILFANRKYCLDSGFSEQEVVGKTVQTLISDWTSEQTHELFTTLLQQQGDEENWFQETGTMLRKNGSSFPVEVWQQVTNWDGETAIATIILDISDRQKIQQALQYSEQKYRHLFDALPDGVALFKQDGTLIDCNQELATSHGWSREELIGQSISVLTDAEHLPQQDELMDALNSADSFVAEGVDRHRDGTVLPMDAHAKAVTIQGQRLMVTVLRDVSERNQHIQELKQQKSDIEQFAYSISHDLKSPLITIEGFAEILGEHLQEKDFDEAHSDLQRIIRAAAKMQLLLTELLDHSRLTKSTMRTQPVNITAVIEDAIERVAGQVVNAGATIVLQEDLPTVNGHPGRLAQLYQNLIDNAIKFNIDNQSIIIELGWDPTQKCLFIDDNGPGISLQFQQKIFGLFDQLDPQQSGSGIGLATVKRIIEIHGGKIWVVSPSPLGGTRFCFTLPNG